MTRGLELISRRVSRNEGVEMRSRRPLLEDFANRDAARSLADDGLVRGVLVVVVAIVDVVLREGGLGRSTGEVQLGHGSAGLLASVCRVIVWVLFGHWSAQRGEACVAAAVAPAIAPPPTSDMSDVDFRSRSGAVQKMVPFLYMAFINSTVGPVTMNVFVFRE